VTELHKHHRKRRSQGGDDSPANILHVHPEVHEWIHRNPEQAFELGWLVHGYEEPSEVSVKIPERLIEEPQKLPKPTTKREGPVKVASFKAPDDDPEAAQRLKDKSEQLRDKFNAHGHKIGKTVAVERALDFTLLNAGEDDF
jgi:hypothetical protein